MFYPTPSIVKNRIQLSPINHSAFRKKVEYSFYLKVIAACPFIKGCWFSFFAIIFIAIIRGRLKG